jgi:DNA-binding winged helix-turn-helix (wHTH) protein/Tol biopolymer transport system component
VAIPLESERTVRFGKFELDLRTRELQNNGQKSTLQDQPFQILAALLERPGQLVTRDELTKRLWPSDTFVDFEHSLNKAVNRLREALEDSAEHPRLIETLPRRGYRFIGRLGPAVSPESETSTTVRLPSAERPAAKPLRSRYSLLRFGIILGLACLMAIWLWLRHRDTKPPQPDFQRLSFGRGTIRTARFAPDGQSVVYGAAWDGKPSQLFLTKAGSFGSRPLGVEADILAISPSGEMAILLDQHFGMVASQGTLALMSLAGGPLRKLLDHVQGADWSPDGSKLAVTHYVSGHCALEFPQGNVVYETTGGAWLSHPRISPRGDQIAFLEHPIKGNDDGFVEIIDLVGKKKVLSRGFGDMEGLAWDPAGGCIWFSGREPGPSGPRKLFKVLAAGQQHLVRGESSNLTLHDLSRDGRMLLTRDTLRGEVFGRIGSGNQERELGWLDYSVATDLSPDGGTIVLSVQEEASGVGYEVYLRRTDNSQAVRLGEGFPAQLSRDGKWVMVAYPWGGIQSKPAPQLLLLPTGAGQPVALTHDSISHYFATLLPDGRRILFEGSEPGHARRNWVQNVAGGTPAPITPEGTVGHRVSPDGKLLVAADSEGIFWLYPMDGDHARALFGIEPGEDPVSWSADGKYLFVASEGIPTRVYRAEVNTGRRQLVYTLRPRDAAGLWGSIWPVLVTPDGKSYAYSDYRILSDLYLVSGLR